MSLTNEERLILVHRELEKAHEAYEDIEILQRHNEVRITPEERKQRAVSMGYDAWKQQVSAASKDTDVTDVTDVS